MNFHCVYLYNLRVLLYLVSILKFAFQASITATPFCNSRFKEVKLMKWKNIYRVVFSVSTLILSEKSYFSL